MKKIVITGASGFIGGHLTGFLSKNGYKVVPLSRNSQVTGWNPHKLDGWENQLKNADVIINLAGANIGSGRWTRKRKAELINSRLQSIEGIFNGLDAIAHKPDCMIQFSGIGYYGNQGEQELTSQSPKGSGFIADLSDELEQKFLQNDQKINRKIIARMGIVLGTDGGALPKLALPFKLFVGGPIGQGKQQVSWIHIEDVCQMIMHLIESDSSSGIYNGVAPNPLSNRELSKDLGKVLKRPSFFPVPPFMLRILLGEMADELLLASQRVFPTRLTESGFIFQFPRFRDAITDLYSSGIRT